MPDIPRVKKRKTLPAKKWRLDGNIITYSDPVPDFIESFEGQSPEHDSEKEANHSEESHDESVKVQGRTRKSPHSESGSYRKLMTSVKGQNIKNTDVLMAKGTRQHVVTTKNTHRHAVVNKHAGQNDVAVNQHGETHVKPNKLDWTKLKKIITSKPLAHGTSYLCGWLNRAPQWIKESLIPDQVVSEYEKRVCQRRVMQQLNKAYGNMN